MRQATVRSRCECEARLVATLNEDRFVISGYSADRNGIIEPAPAHSIGAKNDPFDVGWLCGVCGRNALRSFSAESLLFLEVESPPT